MIKDLCIIDRFDIVPAISNGCICSTKFHVLDTFGDTLATTFMDEPYEYPDGSPVNNASRSYGGETTIRKAIQNSINVVAACWNPGLS